MYLFIYLYCYYIIVLLEGRAAAAAHGRILLVGVERARHVRRPAGQRRGCGGEPVIPRARFAADDGRIFSPPSANRRHRKKRIEIRAARDDDNTPRPNPRNLHNLRTHDTYHARPDRRI